MDKCQRILWSAVLAMLMSAISRDVGVNSQVPNEGGESEVVVDREQCESYGLCMHGSVQLTIVRTFGEFSFDVLTRSLSGWCTQLSDCDRGQCTDESTIRYTQVVNTMVDVACDNIPQFEAGAECWKAPFMSSMRTCSTSHMPKGIPTPGGFEPMFACFAGVPEGIPACSQADASFVVNVTTTLTQSMMGWG